jgi:ElaB/YqjD/DUF883 family membrane-anchored ribosome-binding protein
MKPRNNIMETKNHTGADLGQITDETQDLIAATANVTEEKIISARNRLMAAMDAAKETYAKVQQKAVDGARAADKVVRDNPYQAIGVAFGLGALLGFLISRRGRD